MYFYLPVLAFNNDFLTLLNFQYLLVQFCYEEKLFYGKFFYDGRLKFLILLIDYNILLSLFLYSNYSRL